MPYVQFLGWRKKMTTWSWGLDCHRGLELWWCQILYVYLFLLMVLVGFLPKHLRCEKSPQLVSCWKCHQPVSGAICAKLVTTDCKNGIRLVSGLTYQNFLPNYNLHLGTRGQTIEVYTEKNVRISIIGFIGCLYMPYLPDMYMFCLWIFFLVTSHRFYTFGRSNYANIWYNYFDIHLYILCIYEYKKSVCVYFFYTYKYTKSISKSRGFASMIFVWFLPFKRNNTKHTVHFCLRYWGYHGLFPRFCQTGWVATIRQM